MCNELRALSSAVSDEWIRDNENVPNIVELFINSDISQTSLPVFDSGIFSMESFYMRKDIFVQVDEIVDISLPYEKRRNFVMDGKGTLKFLLDDGFSKFVGISKSKINYFDPVLFPGIKILIKKGTLMKYGVVFLDNENTRIIGGKSEKQIERRRLIVAYNPKQSMVLEKREENKTKKTEKKNDRTCRNKIKTVPLEIVHYKQKKTEFLSSDDNDFIPYDAGNNSTMSNNIQNLEINDIINKDENETISSFQLSNNCLIENFGNLIIAKNSSSLYFTMSCIISDKINSVSLKIAKQEIQQCIDSTPNEWLKMEIHEQNLKFNALKEKLLTRLNPVVLIDRGKGSPSERYVVCSNEFAKSVNAK